MTVPSGNLVASRQPADPCANLDGFEALLPEVSKRAGCSRDGASTAAERRLACGLFLRLVPKTSAVNILLGVLVVEKMAEIGHGMLG